MSRILFLAVTASALVAAASFAGDDDKVVVERDGSHVECSAGSASAVTDIGSIPEGTVTEGSIERRVRTGNRVTIASAGDGRTVCAAGDEKLVQEILEQLGEAGIRIELD